MGEQTLLTPTPECPVIMHWPGQAECKSSSDHGPPSSLQSRGCSHNPTFCVPFKIKKWVTAWSSKELPHHCGFHIVARAQGIVRKVLLGGGQLAGVGPHLIQVEWLSDHRLISEVVEMESGSYPGSDSRCTVQWLRCNMPQFPLCLIGNNSPHNNGLCGPVCLPEMKRIYRC